MINKIYQLLTRKTNTISFIPQIDGLRFLAIFMVIVFHINTFVITKAQFVFAKSPLDYWWLYQILYTDRKGVMLFFVISGFILALPFAKNYWKNEKPVDLKKYFFRRLTRLEPPYIITMVACFLALTFYVGHDFAASFAGSHVSLASNLAASLVYMHNIIYPKLFSVNPVAWSLEIEIQFYLLVPLLVLILKLPKLSRRVLLVFLIAFFIFIQNLYKPPFYSLYNYIQYFLVGFLLVDAYLSEWKIKLSTIASFLIGGLCLIFILYVDLYRNFYFEYIFALSIFVLYLLALKNSFWQKIFGFGFFTVIGGMCYSIYLLHNNIISLFGNKTVFLHLSHSYPLYVLEQIMILTAVCLFFSTIFYLLIERPCMDKDWPKKLWNFFIKRLRINNKP
jgi:peptidoglycan/LPS O-acetylase OafA/YrhL